MVHTNSFKATVVRRILLANCLILPQVHFIWVNIDLALLTAKGVDCTPQVPRKVTTEKG